MGRQHSEHLFQPRIGLAGGDKTLPLADCELHWRRGAAGADGAGHDRPARDLAHQGQIGADPEHGRLHHHTEHLAEAAHAANHIARLGLQQQILRARLEKTVRGAVAKTHGAQNIGIAGVGVSQRHARGGGLANRGLQALGHEFREQRQHDQDQHAAGRQHPQDRVQHVDEHQVDRDPRHIEQRDQALAGEEAANGVDVAHRLQRRRRRLPAQRQLQRRGMGRRHHDGVDAAAQTHQRLRAQQIDDALKNIEPGDQHRQRDQGRGAVAGQHAVIDLQHVE